jgi:hypothetical protein
LPSMTASKAPVRCIPHRESSTRLMINDNITSRAAPAATRERLHRR